MQRPNDHEERAYLHSPLSFLRSYQRQLAEDFLSKLAAAEGTPSAAFRFSEPSFRSTP